MLEPRARVAGTLRQFTGLVEANIGRFLVIHKYPAKICWSTTQSRSRHHYGKPPSVDQSPRITLGCPRRSGSPAVARTATPASPETFELGTIRCQTFWLAGKTPAIPDTMPAMFAFLRGRIARKAIDHIELDVGGVGYEVLVSDRVHARLSLETEVQLLTYCHIREDAFQIFGFLHEEERALFKTLLSISGVGPKVALAVLSCMTVQEVGRAVLDHDVTAFTKVSGIGKKGAQRIVLEMKAKLGQDAELSAILGEPEAEAAPDSDDVIAALCSLGCTLGEAKRAAQKARKEVGEGAPDEEVVRAALRSMAKV